MKGVLFWIGTFAEILGFYLLFATASCATAASSNNPCSWAPPVALAIFVFVVGLILAAASYLAGLLGPHGNSEPTR